MLPQVGTPGPLGRMPLMMGPQNSLVVKVLRSENTVHSFVGHFNVSQLSDLGNPDFQPR